MIDSAWATDPNSMTTGSGPGPSTVTIDDDWIPMDDRVGGLGRLSEFDDDLISMGDRLGLGRGRRPCGQKRTMAKWRNKRQLESGRYTPSRPSHKQGKEHGGTQGRAAASQRWTAGLGNTASQVRTPNRAKRVARAGTGSGRARASHTRTAPGRAGRTCCRGSSRGGPRRRGAARERRRK